MKETIYGNGEIYSGIQVFRCSRLVGRLTTTPGCGSFSPPVQRHALLRGAVATLGAPTTTNPNESAGQLGLHACSHMCNQRHPAAAGDARRASARSSWGGYNPSRATGNVATRRAPCVYYMCWQFMCFVCVFFFFCFLLLPLFFALCVKFV